MNLCSTLLENTVNQFSKLPGIGKKTALRLALHILKQDMNQVENFSHSLIQLKKNICFCENCFYISDHSTCSICNNENRDKHVLCVVENIQDVIAIENTQQYNGLYFVLGGVISPLDGIGAEHLHIEQLIKKLEQEKVNELIFALSSTIQADTTMFYIQKRMDSNQSCKVTSIARGISFGTELEFTDEFTLARSLHNRMPILQLPML